MNDENQNASDLVDIARAQAILTQDIAAEIRRRNDLYVEHVHHHRTSTLSLIFGQCWWSLTFRMNRSWINATSFHVSILEKLSNYLGCHHMSVA